MAFEKQKSLQCILPSMTCYDIHFTNRSVVDLEILTIEVTRGHERSNLIKKIP